MDSSEPLLVSNDRAMHRLGVGRTTLYELIGQGELEQVHIGRRSLITTKSIAAYVDRLSQATA
jgi:excisionase family DNA binding protein